MKEQSNIEVCYKCKGKGLDPNIVTFEYVVALEKKVSASPTLTTEVNSYTEKYCGKVRCSMCSRCLKIEKGVSKIVGILVLILALPFLYYSIFHHGTYSYFAAALLMIFGVMAIIGYSDQSIIKTCALEKYLKDNEDESMRKENFLGSVIETADYKVYTIDEWESKLIEKD